MSQLYSVQLRGNPRLQQAANNKNIPIAFPETDSAVAQLQTGLLDLGYSLPQSTRKTGGPDGIFGPETQQVLKQFQREHSLTDDGMAGPLTLGLMDGLLLDHPAPRHRPNNGPVVPAQNRCMIAKRTVQDIDNVRPAEEHGGIPDIGPDLGLLAKTVGDDYGRLKAHPLEQGDPDPNTVVASQTGAVNSTYVMTKVDIVRDFQDLGTKFRPGFYINSYRVTRSYRYFYGPGNASTRVQVNRLQRELNENGGVRDQRAQPPLFVQQPANYIDP